jgi:tellurite resistance-related uncharacterized protein
MKYNTQAGNYAKLLNIWQGDLKVLKADKESHSLLE